MSKVYEHKGPTVRADSPSTDKKTRDLLEKHLGPKAVIFNGGSYVNLPEAVIKALTGAEKKG